MSVIIFMHAKCTFIIAESLGGFDHVRALMTRSVSTECIALATCTLKASSVSARDQGRPGSLPSTFKSTFRLRMKQSGGDSQGTRLLREIGTRFSAN